METKHNRPLSPFVEALSLTLVRPSISKTYPSHFLWCVYSKYFHFGTLRQNKRYRSVSHELITPLHFAPFLLEAENFLIWRSLRGPVDWKRGQISLSSFRRRNKRICWLTLSHPVGRFGSVGVFLCLRSVWCITW